MQAEVVIRLVLPEGIAAPDRDATGPTSLNLLVGALVYALFPEAAQDVQCDIDVVAVADDSQQNDLVAPGLRLAELPVSCDSEFGLYLPRD